MIAKRIIDRIAVEDVKTQCTKDPQCHRKNGHADRCQSFAVVMLAKAEAWIRGKLS